MLAAVMAAQSASATTTRRKPAGNRKSPRVVGGASSTPGKPVAYSAPAAPGEAFPVPVLGTESTAQMMERERRTPLALLPISPRPEPRYPDRHGLPQNPASPPVSGFSSDGPAWSALETSRQPAVAQTLGTSFTGATLNGTNPTQAFPPDSMGDVGPAQYVVMVNNRIVTFNKNTGAADGVINVTTNGFFSSVRSGSTTSDPRIRYDRLTARWFLSIINVATPNKVLFAVSDAASAGVITASTVWTLYAFTNGAGATCLADYPTLGVDKNALYIGVNNFCGASLDYAGTDGYVIPKAPLLTGGTASVFRFPLVATAKAAGPYTPQGVDNNDPAASEGYFIGVDNQGNGTLVLRRVFTPDTTPTISADIPITVPTTYYPLDVPHLGNTLGSSGELDALDDRLYVAQIRNGRLWTAHNIAVTTSGVGSSNGDRDGVRWYELNGIRSSDNGGVPVVVQAGTIFDSAPANPRYFWIPSVMVSGQGHASLGFSTAGANVRVDAAVAGRLSGDSLGTLQPYMPYTASTTAYDPPGDPGAPRRWGDYSYTSLDPLDDMTFWTIQEFCNATNSYGVRVVKLIAPPPATPASSSPYAVNTGLTSTTVTITGTGTSGSGFFDPGTNLSAPALAFSHLTATVSGGVVVNSATYVNPTTATLDLNTTGAAAGNVDVTIVNPDGQSSTGTGTLTLFTGPATVPTITPPSTVTVNTPVNATSCGTAVTFSGAMAATATGNPPPAITYSPVSGSVFPAGTTSVTATATNIAGSASSSFNVVVQDGTPPTITCQDVDAVTPLGTTSAVVAFSVATSDLCGASSVVNTPASGSTFPIGTTTVHSTATDAAGNTSSCSFNVKVVAGTGLYLVAPCRLLDTRDPAGPLGGPVLASGAIRNVTAAGACGIPAGARSLMANVTVVNATAGGWLTLFPGPAGGPLPFVSNLNYVSGKALANNAVIPVGPDGTINIYNSGPSSAHVIIDVSGYFK
jgi:hypothetical protein